MYIYTYGGGLRLCHSAAYALYTVRCASWCRQVAVQFAKTILPRGTCAATRSAPPLSAHTRFST